ncbi:hypothetical protein GCM10011344_46920 [Dokdonia pacifica]|uniref:Uncharacterized protein n=1 Tax=Dokdonia pacifica TaxID=1627892 RepID=A0A239D790_9FLAO|nr:hypothetical protein [Dokdonia pacifica]GGG40675.1 hypothetical protein GCM10011344_46920 [Dokdonia pacifica]SNS27734.1 hypothetical protein SAMN06265376_1108 [Dokdonia pacifica]
MKKIIVALAFLGCITINAQQKAVTELGEEVLLYQNGTWKYANVEDEIAKDTPVNPDPFVKDEDATFLLKSKVTNVGVWLDPTEWSFQKSKDNPEAEYELQLKGEDLYGMIITEKLEIPIENLKEIALENGRDAAPDLEVIQEEYRTVNDQKVLFLQLNGTLQGIKFTYYGYYYSSPTGTVQFITYTSQGLLKSYIEDCEKILNGFVRL